MKYGIYVMRDAKVGFLQQFLLEECEEIAVRNFQYAMQRPDTIFEAFTQDFDLYKLGSFDNETGAIELSPVPQLVVSGASVR